MLFGFWTNASRVIFVPADFVFFKVFINIQHVLNRNIHLKHFKLANSTTNKKNERHNKYISKI